VTVEIRRTVGSERKKKRPGYDVTHVTIERPESWLNTGVRLM